MKIKVKPFDFFVFFIFTAVLVFSALKIAGRKTENKNLIVQVSEDKYAYSLDRDAELEFKGLIGISKIKISRGEAWFENSTCENKICVEAGKISRPNEWAACLPNGIIIYIEGESQEEVDIIAN